MALRALLSTALLLNFVLCDTEMGFIFPPNATEAYDDTTIANISVHFNDNMTLEYQLPDNHGQVAVFQACYASVKAMQEREGSTYEKADTCKFSPPFSTNILTCNSQQHRCTPLERWRWELWQLYRCQPLQTLNLELHDHILCLGTLGHSQLEPNGRYSVVLTAVQYIEGEKWDKAIIGDQQSHSNSKSIDCHCSIGDLSAFWNSSDADIYSCASRGANSSYGRQHNIPSVRVSGILVRHCMKRE